MSIFSHLYARMKWNKKIVFFDFFRSHVFHESTMEGMVGMIHIQLSFQSSQFMLTPIENRKILKGSIHPTNTRIVWGCAICAQPLGCYCAKMNTSIRKEETLFPLQTSAHDSTPSWAISRAATALSYHQISVLLKRRYCHRGHGRALISTSFLNQIKPPSKFGLDVRGQHIQAKAWLRISSGGGR